MKNDKSESSKTVKVIWSLAGILMSVLLIQGILFLFRLNKYIP